MNLYLTPEFLALLAIIYIWTIPWKAVALWKSAQRKEIWWFVVFLFVHTVGLLEIFYIFVISKKSGEGKKREVTKNTKSRKPPRRRQIASR